jgi:hypothetical protein
VVAWIARLWRALDAPFLQKVGGLATIVWVASVAAGVVRGLNGIDILSVGLLAVGVIGLVVQFAPASANEGASPDESFRAEAAQLSQRLYEFLADRTRDDPFRGTHPTWGLPLDASEEERQAAWVHGTAEMTKFSDETVARYNQRFAAKAMALCERAIARGWATEQQRIHFEHPMGSMGIEAVARTLGLWGERQL